MDVGRIAIALSLCGCRQVLGIEELPYVADASVEDAAIAYASPECPPCLSSKCEEAAATCAAQPACRAVAGCVARCPRDAIRCRGDCEGADLDTSSGALYRAFDDCRRRSCVRECLGLAGAASMLGASCACVDVRCAKEVSACIQSGATGTGPVGACERYAQCVARLGNTPAATMQCRAREAAGAEQIAVLGACINTAFCPECTFVGGNAYECVGKYAWDKPTTPAATFTARLAEALSAKPIDAAEVTACLPERCSSCDPASPGAITKTSASDGAAALTLKAPFRGCFLVTGKASHVDALFYLGRPVLRDETWSLAMFVRNNLAAFLGLAGIKLTPGRGHISVFAADCLVNASAGIRVEISPTAPETRIGYLVGMVLRTDVRATDSSGAVAIINAPAGLVTIRTYRGDQPIGSQQVWVRPDPNETEPQFVTNVMILPSETPL